MSFLQMSLLHIYVQARRKIILFEMKGNDQFLFCVVSLKVR